MTLRALSSLAGLALVLVALSPPFGHWAHHDLRGHMAQHLLLGMFAPLALVLAAPGTFLLRRLPVPAARRAVRLLHAPAARLAMHPYTALLLDVGALYVLLLTPLFAATQHSAVLHGAVLFHFFAAGCLFTWSIAGRDPVRDRPHFRTRLFALFAAIAAHGTLAKMMYAFGLPRGAGFDLAEIRAAAEWMYYGGSAAELLLVVALFAGAREWRKSRRPAVERAVAGV